MDRNSNFPPYRDGNFQPVNGQNGTVPPPADPIAADFPERGPSRLTAGKILIAAAVLLVSVGLGVLGGTLYLKHRNSRDVSSSANAQNLQQPESSSEQTTLQTEQTTAAPAVIPPTGITLTYNTVTLKVGESTSAPAKIEPQNATDQELLWTSSDVKVAAADSSGTIVGISAGACIITVQAHGDPNVIAYFKVVVEAAESLSTTAVTQSAQPKTYTDSHDGYISAEHAGQTVSMYAEPNVQSDVLQKIPDGTLLRLFDAEEIGWYYTTCNGISGYVSAHVTDKTDSLFDGNGYVAYISTTTGESVNLRSTPAQNGSVLTKIPHGTAIFAGATVGDWRGITYQLDGTKYQGFVASRLVSDHPEPLLLKGVITTTTGENVNLRSSPSTDSRVITKIPNGTTVEAESWDLYAGEWYRIRYNGNVGYVRQDLVRH